MSSLLKYLREIIFLIGDDRKKIKWMILAFFTLSIFDLVGIGLIVPYIALIANPDIFTQSDLYPLFLSIGFSPHTGESLITLSYLLLTIFFRVIDSNDFCLFKSTELLLDLFFSERSSSFRISE